MLFPISYFGLLIISSPTVSLFLWHLYFCNKQLVFSFFHVSPCANTTQAHICMYIHYTHTLSMFVPIASIYTPIACSLNWSYPCLQQKMHIQIYAASFSTKRKLWVCLLHYDSFTDINFSSYYMIGSPLHIVKEKKNIYPTKYSVSI